MAALIPPIFRTKRRTADRRQIILHIGRNKAGSTTIQDFCLAAREDLQAHGVDYVLFGHLADSQPGVPGFRTFEELLADPRARPGQKQLVSNEFMFPWPDAYIEATAKALAGADVQVLAYVRPYDAWVVSAYAEETRRGMNMRDIDEYLAWIWPRVSAWPHLRKWAECFGWDRLRVRQLGAENLHGGELIADFAHALGAPLSPSFVPRSNLAPHWVELELVRQLAERNGEVEWAGLSSAIVEPLLTELRPLLQETPAAAYLSLAQRRRLIDLYNEDLARMRLAGGDHLQEASPATGAERPFAPTLRRAPDEILKAFFQRTGQASFAAVHFPAAVRAQRLRAERFESGQRRFLSARSS